MFERQVELIKYKFENFMSRGGTNLFVSLIALFFVFFFVAVLIRGIVLLVAPNYGGFETFSHHVWIIFLAMTDPGNMHWDSKSPLRLKVTIIIAGMLGVIIFSMLIAFITTGMYEMLEELKKGHSKVLESEQTLILGWSERVMGIIKELIIANESESNASIVILAEREKVEMDDEIDKFFPDTKTTRVITRSGNTSSLTDLRRVSACKAKSAIILANCSESATREEKRNSDARVIKTILALQACQKEEVKREGEKSGKEKKGGEKSGKEKKGGEKSGKEKKGGEKSGKEKKGKEEEENSEINIVAELFFESNRQLLETMDYEDLTSIDSWDILGKLLVQTSRTCGLAVVYDEILSFDGCELYFHGAEWGGIKFYDLLYHFPDGIPLGIRHEDGSLTLRPGKEDMMGKGDEVLILAEDDSTIEFRRDPVVVPTAHPFTYRTVEKHKERELLLGWHNINTIVIREYADYLVEGSSIDIMVHQPTESIITEIEKLKSEHGSLEISLIEKDPMSLEDLTSVDPYEYDNILILSHTADEGSVERADSETLVILLLLRKIFRDLPQEERRTKIISQILNSENQDLIAQTNVDDFLISNKMVTMIFSQLSEEAGIKKVYDDIFEEDGSEIYLKPVSLYFDTFPKQVTFADMMAIAVKRDEICLGLRKNDDANDYERNFGIKLNPAKDTMYTLGAEDSLVVLAEDEL